MLRKAIVVACHPEDNSVDLVMCDDGARLSGVPVMSQSASARSGSVDMPEMPNASGDAKWDVTKRHGQDMEALVAVMGRGNPIVVGFIYPQISQMTFEDKKRRFSRHQSDVYHTTDGSGNTEFYHPSGAYVRIAESTGHEDLEKKNFDESLVLDRNKDKQVSIHVQASGGKSSITIHVDGTVTINASSKITCNTPLLEVPNGDVVASGVSLKGHGHTRVKPGTGVSGPPGGGASTGGEYGDWDTSGADGGGGGGEGGGGEGGGFQPKYDKHGNLVQYDGRTGNYYIQSQQRVPFVSGQTIVVPEGDVIYTDANGDVLPTVTIPGGSSYFIDSGGRIQTKPDTIIAQTVPVGDPLPNNGNKAPSPPVS